MEHIIRLKIFLLHLPNLLLVSISSNSPEFSFRGIASPGYISFDKNLSDYTKNMNNQKKEQSIVALATPSGRIKSNHSSRQH